MRTYIHPTKRDMLLFFLGALAIVYTPEIMMRILAALGVPL